MSPGKFSERELLVFPGYKVGSNQEIKQLSDQAIKQLGNPAVKQLRS